MRSNNGLLYVILDDEVIQQYRLDVFSLASELSGAGVDLFQFRFKNTADNAALEIAKRLAKLIHRRQKIFIVNDRVDIAYLSGADGVHLGKGDLLPKYARTILGRDKIIGRTVHSGQEFNMCIREAIDYISLGPVFKTKTKPTLTPWRASSIARLLSKTKKISFVIGGITLDNVARLKDEQITNIALCRGILLSKNPKKAAQEFKKCLLKVS